MDRKGSYNFEHIISLGGNCYVAEDLIKLGLRSASYPFDWCLSCDSQGIIDSIENSFEDFLNYDLLAQHKENGSRYYNEKYQLSFFHDFDKFLPLKKQLSNVEKKYERRIKRFLDDICEPTLFIRYLVKQSDVRYIRENHEKFDKLIKSFCPENKIIYITHSDILSDLPLECYIVEKDENDWITKTPILKSEELTKKLNSMDFKEREKNLTFKASGPHKRSTDRSFEKFLRRTFNKPYIHSKTY